MDLLLHDFISDQVKYRSKYVRKIKLTVMHTLLKLPTVQLKNSAVMHTCLRSIHKYEGDDVREYFYALYLLNSGRLIAYSVLSIGGTCSTIADPKIIISLALQYGAASIVIAHNHPSGEIIPSQHDKRMTDNLKQIAQYLGMRLLDHIILSWQDNMYFSFSDEGLL